MIGIPIDGPVNVFYNDDVVIKSTPRPESTLKKKSLSICYHMTSEALASVS